MPDLGFGVIAVLLQLESPDLPHAALEKIALELLDFLLIGRACLALCAGFGFGSLGPITLPTASHLATAWD